MEKKRGSIEKQSKMEDPVDHTLCLEFNLGLEITQQHLTLLILQVAKVYKTKKRDCLHLKSLQLHHPIELQLVRLKETVKNQRFSSKNQLHLGSQIKRVLICQVLAVKVALVKLLLKLCILQLERQASHKSLEEDHAHQDLEV